jgi:hypothetical protein
MELKPGSRWKSAVCDTEVVVVRAVKEPAELQCGGHAMVAHNTEKPTGLTLSPEFSGGTQPGKRFADEVTGLEILATKGGAGSLSIDGRAIGAKEAKKLPASD